MPPLTKVEQIQAEIDNKNAAIEQEAANGQQTNHEQIIQWRAEINVLEDQKRAEEAQQQNLQERVEQAKETGYLLDTLTASNGMTMAELSYSPENHELVCIAVQKAFLSQQDAFNAEIEKRDSFANAKWEQYLTEKEINDDFSKLNIQMTLDIADFTSKLKNATDIIAEKDAEIKRLQEQQVNSKAVEVATLSAEEQETKLINDLMGKRIKVTNLHPKSDDFNNKMFIATNALTGVEFEDYILYSKRYEEVSEAEAVQLRADYESKKAEINASIPSITQKEELKPLEMPKLNATQEEHPKDEAEVQAADGGTTQGTTGNAAQNEVVEQTTEQGKIATTPVSRQEHEVLRKDIEAIKAFVGFPVVQNIGDGGEVAA